MFSTSTQCKNWMFNSEDELNKLREAANLKHIQAYGRHINEAARFEFFLTAEEEKIMVKRYEIRLRDFCKRFQPPMTRCVIGTAFHYFKRFYIHNSVMNHHPKEIMVTCIYLACKVEEFNVSIQQFVANLKGDREKATDIILNNELLLMEQLNFQLSIHNPFRPVEGLLIDIKTRCALNDPERLRPGTEHFLERAFLTDVVLLYSPSQVALAAVLHAASKLQENLDSYVTDTLFGVEGSGKLAELIEAVRAIRSIVKMVDATPDKNQQKLLDKKLEKCRNPENNPDSEIYKKRMQALLDEDDDLYHRISTRTDSLDNSALGMSVGGSPEVA
ncbi:cyclin-H [Tribolium castaneum]|uniref:Cyclin-H n=1 Tax=Tribolium castaneum TaxID=7070 RepID=D6WRD7_TRICA|nr:PREDICTED: cyclin-H [Tribolium castaneum]EFA06469.1 Cyclin-H-like Protein [Tribolium castaneum]|eukprot:XP_972970.1 PREDICTED: cyclin-H [Tribolium castaneum]